VRRGADENATATMIFKDEEAAREMLSAPPNEALLLLMRGRMRARGNLAYLSLFNYYLSLLLRRRHRKMLAKTKRVLSAPLAKSAAPAVESLTGEASDTVRVLDEPYLARYSLDDFPRLRRFLDAHFETMPEICVERPALLTRWFRDHGFEADSEGRPWSPVLRQARAFKFLMQNKQPLIREGDLIGGTTTMKDIGVVIYPDAHGAYIWGELLSAPDRPLNPYRVSKQVARILHEEVFPYWASRSFREWVRRNHDQPLCQELDDRFAVYTCWKTIAISHTVLDFPKLLRLGARGVIAEIEAESARDSGADDLKRDTLEAMRLCLEGVVAHARNIAMQARIEAGSCGDPVRHDELLRIADACDHVPEHPARTLDEAVQAVWIGWIAAHMENTNTGLSLGRMDQWLQPYFESDLEEITDPGAREAYVRHAIELLGCFYLRCTDHLPLVPDIGNYLFGGSSSDQAITLGGMARDGSSAVNDMTYVLLKVTEMLKLRDPNVNARYSLDANSDTYLRRLAEVNLVTTATPSIHGDENVMASLGRFGYRPEDVRDWSAIGCVEPTISGQHMGHTGSMMFNMVAALEMALNDGLHPLMDWKVGPSTGDPAKYPAFEDFFAAFRTQLDFLVEQATTYNKMLGEAHALIRPTPLLSSLISGSIRKGRDVTVGGARFNTSGVACIGLTDIVDSMMAIKHLVYDERLVEFSELLAAVRSNFDSYEQIHAMIENKVPKFGSGNADALQMANRVAGLAHELFSSRRSFRGGPYTTGFWSMSNHVAFGGLTGALPSGRRTGKAFTPGLTPSPGASPNLLDNLGDVAALEPTNLDNNVAFNVKYVPAASDSHARAVDNIAAYAKGYFSLGGMQMQLNVVSSETLRDAMEHPENYRDLLVRISGYNAYFVTLNHDMQIELIERAEYGG